MKKKKNRRTLRKRIRRALSLTAFITVLFLGGVAIFLIVGISTTFIKTQSEKACSVIQEQINSGMAATVIGIPNIENINQNNPRVQGWLNSLDRYTVLRELSPFTGEDNNIYVTIEINGVVAFSNEDELGKSLSSLKIYRDTESTLPIKDRQDREIGTVTVQINGKIIIVTIFVLSTVVVMLSIAALIIAKIFNMFLVIPIIKPIDQLDTKIRAIAEGELETAMNTELVLKRPLREIESLIGSTNTIMRKLHGYNEMLENQKEMLENQKEMLENQNSELEAQNEELIESKLQIQQQQAQLVQSEKMASVGMLTAAITHEINTPIGAINSNAQLEEMLLGQLQNHPSLQKDEELNAILTQLKEVNDVNLIACSRIIEIIKSLKSFSRLDQADFKEANINEGIKSVLVLTHNLLKRRITVHENYEDIPPVKCYPGQLNQVVMNIIVNASQAIEGEGEIFIHTYQKDKDIYISIRDTGAGIKREDIPKIFEPGYTTKGVGIGLGLGLYISYNIIQNHKGKISVISEPGKGAEFIITIPMDIERT